MFAPRTWAHTLGETRPQRLATGQTRLALTLVARPTFSSIQIPR